MRTIGYGGFSFFLLPALMLVVCCSGAYALPLSVTFDGLDEGAQLKHLAALKEKMLEVQGLLHKARSTPSIPLHRRLEIQRTSGERIIAFQAEVKALLDEEKSLPPKCRQKLKHEILPILKSLIHDPKKNAFFFISMAKIDHWRAVLTHLQELYEKGDFEGCVEYEQIISAVLGEHFLNPTEGTDKEKRAVFEEIKLLIKQAREEKCRQALLEKSLERIEEDEIDAYLIEIVLKDGTKCEAVIRDDVVVSMLKKSKKLDLKKFTPRTRFVIYYTNSIGTARALSASEVRSITALGSLREEDLEN